MKETHVLIVEDEETTLRSLIIFLARSGFKVTTAANGKTGLEKMKEFSTSDEPIDFLVYDLRLPEMTGIELIDKLKEEGLDCPNLAMTGYASKQLTDDLRERGHDLLEKPFVGPDLVEKIKEILGRNAAPDPE